VTTLPERIEKRCLNCEALIYGRFCQACGQENVQHATSFFGMLKHFVFDLLHFDGKFFRTMGLLYAKPGYVPYQFISGKRRSFLEPFKMYIFASTVMFIVLGLFSSSSKNKQSKDTVYISMGNTTISAKDGDPRKYNSYQDFRDDFIKQNNKTSINAVENFFVKWYYNYSVSHDVAPKDFGSALAKDAKSFMPKLLFFLLPVFTWMLQLLYIRRKYEFSIHGILTLYLFSFWFINIILFQVIEVAAVRLFNVSLNDVFGFVVVFGGFFYLMRAIQFFYKSSLGASFLRTFLLCFFGSIVLSLFTVLFIALGLLFFS
jgi:hypothetical protein